MLQVGLVMEIEFIIRFLQKFIIFVYLKHSCNKRFCLIGHGQFNCNNQKLQVHYIMVIFKKHHSEHSQKYVLHISEFSCRHFIKMSVILMECLFPQNNIFTKHQFRQMPSLVFHFATKLFFFPDLVIEKKFKLKIVVKNSLCHANFKNRKPF